MNDLIVKNVNVLGDNIMAAKDENGNVWAGVKWFCQGLGLSEGQTKSERKKIQEDLILSKGGRNLPLHTGGGTQNILCLRIDFIPIWLAKMNITPSMQKDHPELADKLHQYQLKAKDILAEAFIPKQGIPQTTDEKIILLAQGHVELKAEIDSVKADLDQFKQDMPILGIEIDKITAAVHKRGKDVLGGKESNAYNNRSLRGKVYSDIYRELKRQFGVTTYKAIRRSQSSAAIAIVDGYELPLVLVEQVQECNAQVNMDLT